MWSSEPPRRALLLGALALGGCGFAPAHAPGRALDRLQGRVAIETPADVLGYALRRRLIDRLGQAPAPAYLLEIAIEERRAASAVSAGGAAVRYRLDGAADYVLRPAAGGAALARGRVEEVASHAAVLGTVASDAAARDARERLALLLAERIVARLAALETLP